MRQTQSSYLILPPEFYSRYEFVTFPHPKTFLFNQDLNNDLGIVFEKSDDLTSLFSNSQSTPYIGFSQAYAGHQFGQFTMLGDGRAALLGEILNAGKLFDIQCKGSGVTPYSRGGDGKATLPAMVREYLISETMHALGIPSSRSLAVIQTGEEIFRQKREQGAILMRTMSSHIRIGTFEYARYFLQEKSLHALLIYTIERHFPELRSSENLALSFIDKVAELQFDLLCHWMRVGFIHGVMNTDNTAICGETFDYGPCAFLNQYEPDTVFSSIDRMGRYAFGNQPNIIQWNLVRLTEALLPLIDQNETHAVAMGKSLISTFSERWEQKYMDTMVKKIGFENANENSISLVNELLILMQKHAADYTNTFAGLCYEIPIEFTPWTLTPFKDWKTKWENELTNQNIQNHIAVTRMQKVNPCIIPRNHIIEELLLNLNSASSNQAINDALIILKRPYCFNKNTHSWIIPPTVEENQKHKTFCGT